MTLSVVMEDSLPGERLDVGKVPGHWFLAKMGTRVLRPGGLELTSEMLTALAIGSKDEVVELAPGLGATARLALEGRPARYTGVERDEVAAARVRKILKNPRYSCQVGTAAQTGLRDESATVVYGEAMLTMRTTSQKREIVREAFRVLKPGGLYGIHELALTPDNLSDKKKISINRDILSAIRGGACPLTRSEWRKILEDEGFCVEMEAASPMYLLGAKRVLSDEGWGRSLKIAFNVLCNPAARRRILAMRRVFRRHQERICALTFVARKPEGSSVY